MNKVSLAGLIFGLTIIGSLFFVIGFLAAVATFGTGSFAAPTTSWASANGPDKKNGAAGALGKFAGAVGGKLLHDRVVHLQSKLGGGALSKVVNHIPPSLQPFAVQAQNHLAIKSQQRINGIVSGGVGAFAPRTFGAAQNRLRQLSPSNYQPQSNVTELPLQQRKGVFYPKHQQHQQAGQPQYRSYPGQPPLQYQMVQPQPQPQLQCQPQPMVRRGY